MPNVTGRIIPERKHFEHQALRLPLKNPEAGVNAWLLLGVINNQVAATIIGDTGNLSNYVLGSIVREAEQALLNAHAFVQGEVFEVDIVGMTKDEADGSPSFFYQENVHDVVAARECRLGIQDIWALMQSDAALYVQRVLNDLRMALSYHNDTPFYCYRAIETIRHDIGRRYELERKHEQWSRTWEVLGRSRDEIDVFLALATALRHGEPMPYTGEEWRKIVLSTWDVVEAYILFALDNLLQK